MSGLARFRIPGPRRRCTDDVSAYITYVLAGRLGGAASNPRLTVQLLRAADRRVLWSEILPLEGLHPDLAGGIDKLIARVVGAVLPTIPGGRRAPQRPDPYPSKARASRSPAWSAPVSA